MTQGTEYTRRFECSAPIRIADCGGWTDTWFGSPGQVCHLAMEPGGWSIRNKIFLHCATPFGQTPPHPALILEPSIGSGEAG